MARSRAWAPAVLGLLLAGCVSGADATLPPEDEPDAAPRADSGAPVIQADATPDGGADAGAALDGGTDGGPDASPLDGATFATATVAAPRELRGVWVATVANIDFPSRTGLGAADIDRELTRIVDLAAAAGLNAIFFQVRPEGDALYRSMFEPWSRFLSGRQGQDPGYDPLALLITRAQARGLEVHAWLNPYRAKSSAASTAAANHMSQVFSTYAYPYGTGVWMDPGAEPVRQRLLDVIRDLVAAYAVDGVHLDDYFYPYPEPNTPFPDDSTYGAYTTGGGVLARDAWRRDNVDRMVQAIDGVVADERPSARFGIAPFGIYRPGQPAGITGLDQFASIYADPPRWIAEGWVDYLAPQLYWPTTQTRQAYGALIAWWAQLPRAPGTWMMAGNNLSSLGSSAAWTLDEYVTQAELTRAQRSRGAIGNIWYSFRPIREARQDVGAVFKTRLYAEPALTPPVARMRAVPVEAPRAERLPGGGVRISHAAPGSLRGYALYQRRAGAWQLTELRRTPTLELPAPTERQAVSAVGLHGVESLAVVVEP